MDAKLNEEGEYDEAIAKEIGWLDEQLVQHVVDELAKRKLGGQIALSAQVDRAIDDAVTRAVAQAVVRHGPALVPNAQTVPLSSAPFEKSRIRFDQPYKETPSAIVMAKPPVDPDRLDDDFADDDLGNSVMPSRENLPAPKPRPNAILTIMALLAAVGLGFGVWQMLRANNIMAQTAAFQADIAKAQTDLDGALCAANYPAVLAAIEVKAEARAALNDADKSMQAYGRYRGAIPDQTDRPSRVDATPPCGSSSSSGPGPDSAP